jgi:hypothetical protein
MDFNHGLNAAAHTTQPRVPQLLGSEMVVVAKALGTLLAKVETETRMTNEKGQESTEAIQEIRGEHQPADISKEIRLNLIVRDPEVIFELSKHDEGSDREGFALSALRLGVLALRQASGMIDATTIRSEGERLLGSVRELLLTNSAQTLGGMTTALKQYFDPANGTLPQRLERLLKKDGELEAVLARHLDGDTSSVARTLAKHLGEQSPIIKLLSPKQSDGVICALTEVIQAALKGQREIVLRQFSLDDKESALSRLIAELTGANGRLRENLSKDLAMVRNEFSLDNEQGALSRLVSRVERAQQTIADQFSKDNENSALCRMSRLIEATSAKVDARLTLDDETSPLSRLRRELLQVLDGFSKSNSQFQSDVRATVEALKARREEASLSTRHGVEFEDAVGGVLQMEAQRLGDVFAATGKTTGTMPYCKVGDHVIELGPESAAPGARVVCEAKEHKTFDAAQALAEIRSARENRKAQAGIFVFSKATAPDGIETLARFGSDILVVWDRDDAGTDVFLKAALSVARALVVREHVASEKSKADFTEIEKAVTRIAKNAEALGEITTWAGTIKNNGQKILDKAERTREDLEKQVSLLRDLLENLREVHDGDHS